MALQLNREIKKERGALYEKNAQSGRPASGGPDELYGCRVRSVRGDGFGRRVLRGDGLAGGDGRENLATAGGRYADLVGGKHRHGG